MLTIKEREQIIRWRNEGKKQQEIARLIGCSQPTVSDWIARHKVRKSLETLPRSGRPTKLTSKNLTELKKKILVGVRSANEKFCSLNTKQLSEIIHKEIGKQYCLRHVERIMHKLGFSLIKPRSKHLKNNPQKVIEFREEFKKNLKRGTWVIPL